MGFLVVESPFFACLLEVLLFVLAAVLVLVKYEDFRAPTKQVQPHSDGRQLWECCCGSLHPGWLCALRVLAFLYLFPVQLLNLIHYGPMVYIFYTQWTFTILIVYFLVAACVSLKQLLLRPSGSGEAAEALLEEGKTSTGTQTDAPGFVVIVVFQVVSASVFLTDSIYWLILVPFVYGSKYYLTFTSFSMHCVNGLFLLGELLLNSMPFQWFRGAYFILLSAIFVVFQWIIHATGLVRVWPYPFLDVSTYWAPTWYLGLGLFHLVVYSICVGLAKAKRPLVNFLKH